MNEIERAFELLGGDSAVARLVKRPNGKHLTPKACRKWRIAGKLPRTEATGETNYAEQMANANPKVKKEKLLSTVMRKQ